MTERISDQFESWGIGQLLRVHKGLELRPILNGLVRIEGTLSFSADAKGLERIDDSYEICLLVPLNFPRSLPGVKELTGRIPKDFHTMTNGILCLGSPSRQKLALSQNPTLPGFVESCVIPYLYGYSFKEKHGFLPFGELKHGNQGLREDYAEIFGIADKNAAMQMVELAGKKKRRANKKPCPCGSGRRLGKCHNRKVNEFRRQLGRRWCRFQYQRISQTQ